MLFRSKDIYVAYRESGYAAKFYEKNVKDILLHQSAKQAYDLISTKTIPTVKNLQLEYVSIKEQNKDLYRQYAANKYKMKQMLTSLSNVNVILNSNERNKTGRLL